MMCITSVEYHVLFNGDRIGSIALAKGLRQGCLLSPYLHILCCAEGLSSPIKHHKFTGKIHGALICRQTPSINHLIFTNDSFLFCKATTTEANCLKDILLLYEVTSGQSINFVNILHMTLVFLSPLFLVTQKPLGKAKYLGLPYMVCRSKKAIFIYLKDRIWKKRQSWSFRSPSRAGKEVLIKSDAKAIPSCCMGSFLIPSTFM